MLPCSSLYSRDFRSDDSDPELRECEPDSCSRPFVLPDSWRDRGSSLLLCGCLPVPCSPLCSAIVIPPKVRSNELPIDLALLQFLEENGCSGQVKNVGRKPRANGRSRGVSGRRKRGQLRRA